MSDEQRTILVVDDDAAVTRLFRRVLDEAGFAVATAATGEAALSAIEVSPPDLVLLDVGLPDVDGIDIVQAVREHASRHIVIVLVTGHAAVAERVRGLDAGADDHMTKPVHVDELVARVKAHLRRDGGRAAGAEPPTPATAPIDVTEAADFTAVYQPIVRLPTLEIVGYEALTRFTDGTPPHERFAVARAAGVGLELEVATMTRAVAGARDLPPGCWLSLNTSSALLLDARRLSAVIRRAERPIVLELSEHDRIDDYEQLHESLRRLGRGVRIAVDDTGEGYASLRHVLALHPAIAKLDRVWITDLDRDPARQAIVDGLQRFAAEIGCLIVAEGIERPEEVEVLTSLGVPLGQGYLLGEPAPVTPATSRTG